MEKKQSKKRVKKYQQIRVSLTDELYLLIVARAEKLGLTKAAYLKMLANQDLAQKGVSGQEAVSQTLADLIAATQACTPQVVVVKEKKRKRAVGLPSRKKTVSKAAIWQYL